MIGINIINNPQQFLAAFGSSHDIGVHTWTHPYMTTLSNLDVLGQVRLSYSTNMHLDQSSLNSLGGQYSSFTIPPVVECRNTGDPLMVIPIIGSGQLQRR